MVEKRRVGDGDQVRDLSHKQHMRDIHMYLPTQHYLAILRHTRCIA